MIGFPSQIALIWLAFFALTGSAMATGAITAAANALQATTSKRRFMSPLQVDGGRFRAAWYPTECPTETLELFARNRRESRQLQSSPTLRRLPLMKRLVFVCGRQL